MGSRAMLLVRGTIPTATGSPFNHHHRRFFSFTNRSSLSQSTTVRARNYSVRSSLEPPDLVRLAQTARISLTPNEVEEFAPKIQEVLDWFGQLQVVDLESIEPSIRADTEGDNLRDDLPETFENREAIISALPSYDEPYIEVPKILNNV